MTAMNQMTTNEHEPALHEVDSSELQAITGGDDVLSRLYDLVRPRPVWQVEFPKRPPVVPK